MKLATKKPAPKKELPTTGLYDKSWGKTWGARFRRGMQEHERKEEQIGVDVNLTPAAIRHYINGTRDPKLRVFFAMCKSAGISPLLVLFPPEEENSFSTVLDAWNNVNEKGREHILVAVRGALDSYGDKRR